MGYRSELEDKHTIVCYGCDYSYIDPAKKPGQRYAKVCSKCGTTNIENQRLHSKIRLGVLKHYKPLMDKRR